MVDPLEDGADEPRGKTATTELSENALSWFSLGISILASIGLVRLLVTDNALDIDPMNLVYGMRRFDIAQHAPHPPGYLLYIGALRTLHALRMGDPSLHARFATAQWLALVFHVATAFVTFAAIRRAQPSQPMRAGFAAMLISVSPFLVFHAIDAQTHCSESFASAVLIFALVYYGEHPGFGRAAALGLALALGAAFRPTFVVTGVVPVIVACWRTPKHLVTAGLTSIAGAACFVVPTLVMSGGFEAWSLAHDALVKGIFVRNASLMSDEGVPEFQAFQLTATTSWLVLLFVPFVVGATVTAIQRHRDPTPARTRVDDPFVLYALAAAAPSTIFYLLVFCSEPGYLNGIVPFLVAALVTRAPSSFTMRRASRAAVAALVMELVILLAPISYASGIKQPTLIDVVSNDVRIGYWLDSMRAEAPGKRVLVVSDFPDLTLARQTPMQRPGAHMLSFYATPRSVFPKTLAGFLTEDAWIPIPGPAHLVRGPERIVDVPFAYDAIVIDGLAGMSLRDAIGRRVTCPIRMRSPGSFVAIPSECIPDRTIELDGQGIRFRAR